MPPCPWLMTDAVVNEFFRDEAGMRERNSGRLPLYRDTFSKRDQEKSQETESLAACLAGEALAGCSKTLPAHLLKSDICIISRDNSTPIACHHARSRWSHAVCGLKRLRFATRYNDGGASPIYAHS